MFSVVKIVKRWVTKYVIKKKGLVPKYATVRIPDTSPAVKFTVQKMQKKNILTNYRKYFNFE